MSSMITVVPGSAHGAHRGEHALADLPQAFELFRHIGECDVAQGGHGLQRGLDVRGCAQARPRSHPGPGLDQQGGRRIRQRRQFRRHARLVLHRTQCGPVHDLHRVDRLGLEQRHCLAGRANVCEEHQGAGLVRVLDHGTVGDLGDEAEGPLRTDHQVLQHVDRVAVVDQGVEAVAGGVLDPELVRDAFGQSEIRAYLRHQRFESVQQVGVGAAKRLAAGRITGIQHSCRRPGSGASTRVW